MNADFQCLALIPCHAYFTKNHTEQNALVTGCLMLFTEPGGPFWKQMKPRYWEVQASAESDLYVLSVGGCRLR